MAETDGELVDRLAKRHSVSRAAVQVVMTALRSGGGPMAQFSHADFGGMSQWSPGMSMVGDMFNTQLKSKLDALCTDIAAYLEQSEPARRWRARCGRRRQLSVHVGIDRLVAVRIGAAWSGRRAERPTLCGLP
jgi:hypothetical protein